MAKRLLILGGILVVAAPAFLFGASFIYGLSSVSQFAHAPSSSNAVAYKEFIQQTANKELKFITVIALVAWVMGLSGLVFLVSGLIRYFFAPKSV